MPIRVIAEPGRVISAESATLVTSVIGKSVRPNGVTQYIIDDGLYGSFSGKVYDHVNFTILAKTNRNGCRIPASSLARPATAPTW